MSRVLRAAPLPVLVNGSKLSGWQKVSTGRPTDINSAIIIKLFHTSNHKVQTGVNKQNSKQCPIAGCCHLANWMAWSHSQCTSSCRLTISSQCYKWHKLYIKFHLNRTTRAAVIISYRSSRWWPQWQRWLFILLGGHSGTNDYSYFLAATVTTMIIHTSWQPQWQRWLFILLGSHSDNDDYSYFLAATVAPMIIHTSWRPQWQRWLFILLGGHTATVATMIIHQSWRLIIAAVYWLNLNICSIWNYASCNHYSVIF